MQAALIGTKDGQKAQQQLAAKADPKQKDFTNRQNEIAQLEDQLRKGGALMNDASREELARKIDDKKKRLQRDTQDAEEELQNEQQQLLQSLGQKLLAVIDKYAADHQYTLVLDDSNPSTPVLFTAAAIDITKDIEALYDAGKPQ